MKLEIYHADTCLPGYWPGHHRAHVQIPVVPGMSGKAIREAIRSEISQGAVMGSDDIAFLLSADYVGEICREDDYQYQQARELEEETDENFSRLRECLALRNRECFAHLREEARRLIASIKEARQTLRTQYADYI